MFNRNFQAVIPEQIYRSAQPESGDLERWVREHGIKTVINMRGKNPRKEWYQNEVEEAQALGLTHINVRMNSEKLPPATEFKRLITLLDTAEKPVLIHCKGGVHRSGLAGASSVLLGGEPLANAKQQFSPTKGFFSWIDDSHMPEVLNKYEAWLGEEPHTLDKFLEWVNGVYIPYFYGAQITLTQPLPQVRLGKSFPVHVVIKNISPEPIEMKSGSGLGVRLGARVFKRGDKHFVPGVKNWLLSARETTTDALLTPGQSIATTMTIAAPKSAGEYDLVIDLVDEKVAWFEKMGSKALVIPVTVTSGS